jgi:hypothetical protein
LSWQHQTKHLNKLSCQQQLWVLQWPNITLHLSSSVIFYILIFFSETTLLI